MSQMIELGIPGDDKLLAALGRLAVAHGNLEMVQIMCLKILKNMRPQEALEEYRKRGAGRVREEIEKFVSERSKTDEKSHSQRIAELLLDARCHSKRRNALIHRFWGKKKEGVWLTSGDESKWEGLPAIEVIDDLVAGILQTAEKLNAERFDEGFIAKLSKRNSRENEIAAGE